MYICEIRIEYKTPGDHKLTRLAKGGEQGLDVDNGQC